MSEIKNEISIRFYAALGHLSTKFAIAEELLRQILNKFITQNNVDEIIGLTIIDGFNLYKILETVKKVNKLSGDFEDEVTSIVDKIDSVRLERNLFVHGLWKDPFMEDGEVKIVVESRKVSVKDGRQKSKYPPYEVFTYTEWAHNSFKIYRLSEIDALIDTLDVIVKEEEDLLDKMEHYQF